MGRTLVQDVMTTDVVSVGETATYRELVALSVEHQISAVPVVDERRCVLGVVSEADLVRRMRADGDTRRLPPTGDHTGTATWTAEGAVAGDLMSAPPITIEPQASLAAAARVLEERRIKRLPVVDRDGVLIGIVSRRDLLRVHLRSDKDIRTDVENRVLWEWFRIGPPQVVVTVHDGVVTLTGEVSRRRQRALAGHLAETVDGVVAVVNRLTYQTDDAPLARPVRHPDFPGVPG
jgi:CBS domain-containing protein